MSRVRRGLAVTLVTLVALVGGVVSAAPVQAMPPPESYDAEPPCEWESGQWGNYSGCDGLYPDPPSAHYSACGGFLVADEVDIRYGGTVLARIWLNYYRGPSGICRTVAATINVRHQNAFNCYVKVERNSDGQAYRAGSSPGPLNFGRTQVLYDAGVTSYAWGYCKYVVNTNPGVVVSASARTRNY